MTGAPGPVSLWSVALSPDVSQLAAGTGRYLDGEDGEVLVWVSSLLS